MHYFTEKMEIDGHASPASVSAQDEITVHPIDKILGHKLMNKSETRFRVKWSKCSAKSSTMEPLEHLLAVPRLVYAYVQESRKSFAASMPSTESDSGATFHQAPSSISNTCKIPNEYIPRGNEKIRKIDFEYTAEKKGTLWYVRFWDKPNVRKLVRKSLMVYYFPIESMIFMKRKEKRAEKLKMLAEI
jgi:hypothetical protein